MPRSEFVSSWNSRAAQSAGAGQLAHAAARVRNVSASRSDPSNVRAVRSVARVAASPSGCSSIVILGTGCQCVRRADDGMPWISITRVPRPASVRRNTPNPSRRYAAARQGDTAAGVAGSSSIAASCWMGPSPETASQPPATRSAANGRLGFRAPRMVCLRDRFIAALSAVRTRLRAPPADGGSPAAKTP
jgi:hypothetical protein